MLRFYRCETCGNLIEMVKDSGANPVCCGKKMVELLTGMTDGARETHIPVCEGSKELTHYEPRTRILTVKVGEKPHPMSDIHSIQWITVQTDRGVYRRILTPGEDPCAQFYLQQDEKAKAIYAYCSLHGLWEKILY